MAKGKQIGEYSLKFTSLTIIPGPAGSVITRPAAALEQFLAREASWAAKVGRSVGVRNHIRTTAIKCRGRVPAPLRVPANTTGARKGCSKSLMAAI